MFVLSLASLSDIKWRHFLLFLCSEQMSPLISWAVNTRMRMARRNTVTTLTSILLTIKTTTNLDVDQT